MSYILDALKKLEKEKAGKSRVGGMVNISGELIKDEQRHAPSGGAWKIAAVVAIAIAATFAATWFFLKGDKERVGAKARPVAQATPASPPAPPSAGPAPAPPVPQTSHSALQPVAPPLPQSPPAQAPAQPPAATPVPPDDEDVAPSSRVRPHRKRQKVRELPAPSTAPAGMPQQSREQAGTQLTPPPADIKVSGIAWQDERRARRAVVNGFLMHEGSVVAGATITEILPDRVRFSMGGRAFDVPLMVSGLPGTGK